MTPRRWHLPSLAPLYRAVIAHPVRVLLVVAVFTGLAIVAIPWIHVDTDFANYLNRNDPAVKAADAAKDRYGSQILLMVIAEQPGGLFDPETLSWLETIGHALDDLSVVDEMTGPLNAQVIRGTESTLEIRSAAPGASAPESVEASLRYQQDVLADRRLRDYVVSSGGAAAAFYVRAQTGTEMVEFAKAVEKAIEPLQKGGARLSIAGIPYMNLTLGRSMGRDLMVFLPLIVAAIIGVLYASFRWWWGVAIPFAIVGISVIWTMALMAATRVPVTVISFILPVVLMAIGIADGIHVLGRYREEIRDTESKTEAILRTMLAMQRPVVLTSLTTAAGFLSLMNSYLVPQRTFGIFAAVGILSAMALSLILIPAVLSLASEPRRRPSTRVGLETLLQRLSGWVVRYRRIVMLTALGLAVVFGVGMVRLRVETSQRAFLGNEHPAVASLDKMEEHFSGGEQILIEIDTERRDGLKDPVVLNEIVALQGFLEELGVRRTASIADIVREMHQRFRADDSAYYTIPDDPKLVAQLLLLFTFQGGDLGALALGDFSAGEVIAFHTAKTGEAQTALVDRISEALDERFRGLADAQMVGSTRIQAGMFASIARSQVTSLGTSIGAAGLIVAALMLSPLSGLISLVPLLFTVIVNFGIMSYAGVPLDIATLMVSSITIGIGIDYGIHFIERFRERRRHGDEPFEAAVTTARTAGRAILYNAVALALGFCVLLFSTFQGMRNFGLLVAMTMIIGASAALTVIPALLVSLAKRGRGQEKRH